MKHCTSFAVTLALSVFTFLPAHADIGAIGSPVVPSNLPPAQKNSTGAPANGLVAPASDERQPLLVIDFNKREVNFVDGVRRVVTATEGSQPLAVYEVVSTIPLAANASRLKIEHLSDFYSGNLSAVVGALQDNGVPPARIHTSIATSDDAISQQISIFVQ